MRGSSFLARLVRLYWLQKEQREREASSRIFKIAPKKKGFFPFDAAFDPPAKVAALVAEVVASSIRAVVAKLAEFLMKKSARGNF